MFSHVMLLDSRDRDVNDVVDHRSQQNQAQAQASAGATHRTKARLARPLSEIEQAESVDELAPRCANGLAPPTLVSPE